MDELLWLPELQAGNENVYKRIFTKYYSPLCEYASHYVCDEDAEELVQELMLYLWESRKELFIESSLKSYLFSATRNRCLNLIKKNQYREQVRTDIYEKLKDELEDPNYYLIDELTEQIEKAIDELPVSYRETFSLSRLRDKTNAEIAALQNVSVKTVEYRITQSIKLLRVRLKNYLVDCGFLF